MGIYQEKKLLQVAMNNQSYWPSLGGRTISGATGKQLCAPGPGYAAGPRKMRRGWK